MFIEKINNKAYNLQLNMLYKYLKNNIRGNFE